MLSPLRVSPPPTDRPPAIPLAEALRRGREERGEESPFVQGCLALQIAAASDERVFGPQATKRPDLPDPRTWATPVAQAIVEVMSGSRPAPQLVRWTTPEVYAVLARRSTLAARRRAQGAGIPRRRALVRRVLVCEPADGVAECAAVVLDGPRVRALAFRLAGQDGRWRVEALQIA